MYDQAQGLTGKYHSTTLNANINIILHILQTRGTEAGILKSAIQIVSEYRHRVRQGAIRWRKHTMTNDRKRRGLLPGNLLNYSWSDGSIQ